MKNQTNIPFIELLNSEGPILKAYKIDETFVIQDEFKQIIAFLDREKMESFLYDKMSLIDSKRREFIYRHYGEGMKPSEESLREFLN